MRLTVAVLLLVGVAAWLWLGSDERPSPVEARSEDTTMRMERMHEPGKLTSVQREPVQAVDTGTPSRAAATLGPLDEPVETALIASFEQQVRSCEQQIMDSPRRTDGDPLGELGADLRVAELQVTAAQMKLATDLIRAKDYVTVKAGTQLPPEVDGFDRIVHGRERVRGEAVEVVLQVGAPPA